MTKTDLELKIIKPGCPAREVWLKKILKFYNSQDKIKELTDVDSVVLCELSKKKSPLWKNEVALEFVTNAVFIVLFEDRKIVAASYVIHQKSYSDAFSYEDNIFDIGGDLIKSSHKDESLQLTLIDSRLDYARENGANGAVSYVEINNRESTLNYSERLELITAMNYEMAGKQLFVFGLRFDDKEWGNFVSGRDNVLNLQAVEEHYSKVAKRWHFLSEGAPL